MSVPHTHDQNTAIVERMPDGNVSLIVGAIPLSRGSICAIDEVNAFSMDDQSRLLDVLDNEGKINVDKMGLRCTIPAPTTIIATANPIGGKWNSDQIATKEEAELKRSLMDRFTQFYASRDNMDAEQTKNFVKQMNKIRKRKHHKYNFLRKYLRYASGIKDIKFTPDAENKLNTFWADGKVQGLFGIRMYEGIFKMAEAQAKLYLTYVVDEDICR